MSAPGLVERIAAALNVAADSPDDATFARRAAHARALGASRVQIRRAWRNYRITKDYRPGRAAS